MGSMIYNFSNYIVIAMQCSRVDWLFIKPTIYKSQNKRCLNILLKKSILFVWKTFFITHEIWYERKEPRVFKLSKRWWKYITYQRSEIFFLLAFKLRKSFGLQGKQGMGLSWRNSVGTSEFAKEESNEANSSNTKLIQSY